MDILVAVAIVGLLLSLAIGAHSFATSVAMRNRTVLRHARILSALEAFKVEHQVYPEPAHPSETAAIDGATYRIGGARMLYQLLSGDGNDEIKPAGASLKASNGKVDSDEPGKAFSAGLNSEDWRVIDGRYFMIDSFGYPFQYDRGGASGAVNATFDIWSFAGDQKHLSDLGAEAKRDPGITAGWIKNF